MIVISFSPELVNDLQLLHTIPTPELFTDIITLSFDIISSKKPSNKMYNKLAKILGENVEQVAIERSLNGLSALLVDCAKKNVSPNQFHDALTDQLGFSEEYAQLLSQQYTTKFPHFRSALHNKASSGTNYVSFDWRFDVEVSSRATQNTFTPSYLCALTLQDEDKADPHTIILQASTSVLSMIHDELTIALAEAKTAHSRRIQKYVK